MSNLESRFKNNVFCFISLFEQKMNANKADKILFCLEVQSRVSVNHKTFGWIFFSGIFSVLKIVI